MCFCVTIVLYLDLFKDFIKEGGKIIGNGVVEISFKSFKELFFVFTSGFSDMDVETFGLNLDVERKLVECEIGFLLEGLGCYEE